MKYTKIASCATCADHPNSSANDRDSFARNAIYAEYRPQRAQATLKASFFPDDSGPYGGLYRSARCELPTGEVVEVRRKRTPLYDLARELQNRGYGEWQLQAYTHKGTPSLRGLVKAMAGLTVEESDSGGLRLRKYRSFPLGRSATDVQVDPAGTPDQATAEAPPLSLPQTHKHQDLPGSSGNRAISCDSTA